MKESVEIFAGIAVSIVVLGVLFMAGDTVGNNLLNSINDTVNTFTTAITGAIN